MQAGRVIDAQLPSAASPDHPAALVCVMLTRAKHGRCPVPCVIPPSTSSGMSCAAIWPSSQPPHVQASMCANNSNTGPTQMTTAITAMPPLQWSAQRWVPGPQLQTENGGIYASSLRHRNAQVRGKAAWHAVGLASPSIRYAQHRFAGGPAGRAMIAPGCPEWTQQRQPPPAPEARTARRTKSATGRRDNARWNTTASAAPLPAPRRFESTVAVIKQLDRYSSVLVERERHNLPVEGRFRTAIAAGCDADLLPCPQASPVGTAARYSSRSSHERRKPLGASVGAPRDFA
jgi:hypothetical protein